MPLIICKFFVLFSLSLIMTHVPEIALFLLKKESSTQKKHHQTNLKGLVRLLKIQNIAVSRTLEQVIRKNVFT